MVMVILKLLHFNIGLSDKTVILAVFVFKMYNSSVVMVLIVWKGSVVVIAEGQLEVIFK